jgi:hypothetical protein
MIGDGPPRFSVSHSHAALRASRLKVGVIVLADADATLGQPSNSDLARADEASAGRLTNAVELAPVLKAQSPSGDFIKDCIAFAT